ncbi:MAG: DUF1801 domain-containing protein [Patescibacteria group bacterium]
MSPSQKIDSQIGSLNEDYRAEIMRTIRQLLATTEPDIKEEWKWNTGVWTYQGNLICALNPMKNYVKWNFFKGAFLTNSSNLFNNGLDSKEHRSIDIRQNYQINPTDLQNLIQEAVQYYKNIKS